MHFSNLKGELTLQQQQHHQQQHQQQSQSSFKLKNILAQRRSYFTDQFVKCQKCQQHNENNSKDAHSFLLHLVLLHGVLVHILHQAHFYAILTSAVDIKISCTKDALQFICEIVPIS